MIRALLHMSICIGLIAVFCTFDIFRPYRDSVLELTPENVKRSIQIVNSKVLSAFGYGKETVFTKEELAKYNGENGAPIYLAIMGQIFDVSKKRDTYGPGGGYHFFTGKDGTRAFVSGDFTSKGLVEEVRGLALAELLGIEGWVDFYHKDYSYVGKLIGTYYDKKGNPTGALRDYQAALIEAKEERKKQQEDVKRYPPCNSESKQGAGRRFWCSERSGGIKRDWAGLPREYYKPGYITPRCACVKDRGSPSDNPQSKDHSDRGDLDSPMFKVYADCDPTAVSCSIPD